MKKFLQAKVEIKADNDIITVIASDETLDRHGDVLPIDQWDLSKFRSSPRMLVDHDHTVASIVGKWTNVRIEDNKLLMDADFHGITELSKAVEKMVNEGYLDTVSVGFIPHGAEKDGDHGSFELIETSWVTVPANPSARVLKDLMSKTLSAEEEQKVKEAVGDEPEKEEEEEKPKENPVVTTEEGFKQFIKDHPEETVLLCEAHFISHLIADNEQQRTLIADLQKKVEASKSAALTRMVLKETVSQLNDSLRKLNKSRS